MKPFLCSLELAPQHGNVPNLCCIIWPLFFGCHCFLVCRTRTMKCWHLQLLFLLLTMEVMNCLYLKRAHCSLTGGIIQALVLSLPRCVRDRRSGNRLWGLDYRLRPVDYICGCCGATEYFKQVTIREVF